MPVRSPTTPRKFPGTSLSLSSLTISIKVYYDHYRDGPHVGFQMQMFKGTKKFLLLCMCEHFEEVHQEKRLQIFIHHNFLSFYFFVSLFKAWHHPAVWCAVEPRVGDSEIELRRRRRRQSLSRSLSAPFQLPLKKHTALLHSALRSLQHTIQPPK